MTEIVGVFGGLRYYSPECKLWYQVKEILDVFVVFQHYSPTCELLNQGKEMHDKFEHGVFICVDVRVVTMVEIIFQLLPYILNPSRNFSCSACVHLPLFWITVKTSVFEDNDD